MARGKLSVCMIVRDEALMLADCLASIKGVFHQLVVVDTGSTDDTVAIAKSFGAQVHHFEWVDDFAAARNESIRHATGDWILWLDADERLRSDSVEPLRKLLTPAHRPTIYRVMIRNLQQDQLNFTLSVFHRLISNHGGIRFSGRIHEQVSPSLKAVGGREKPSDIVLDHLGYALDSDELLAKRKRYQVLLELMTKEQPDSAYAHFTLGQNCALTGDYEAALQAYLRALEIGEFTGMTAIPLLNSTAEACWELGRIEDAEKYARQSLANTEGQSDANFRLYKVMRSRGDIEGQIQCLEKVLTVTVKVKRGIHGGFRQDILLPEQHILFSLGELYLSVENFGGAEKVLRRCLDLEPGSRETRERLASALAQLGRWEDLLVILNELPRPLPDQFRELGGVALIKLRRFEEAIVYYGVWLKDHPAHEGIRRRLAGLHAKIGNVAAAERLLREAPRS